MGQGPANLVSLGTFKICSDARILEREVQGGGAGRWKQRPPHHLLRPEESAESQILGGRAFLLGMCAAASLSFYPISCHPQTNIFKQSSLSFASSTCRVGPEAEEELCPAVKAGQCWMARSMRKTQQPPPPPCHCH